jgi:hypothetical protein
VSLNILLNSHFLKQILCFLGLYLLVDVLRCDLTAIPRDLFTLVNRKLRLVVYVLTKVVLGFAA